MKLALNENELGTLAGLPHRCIVLYLWIRARMDYATGMVGVRPKVSWHAFTEHLYIEPHSGPGEQGSPSVQQVRRMARRLATAGLVKMHSLMNEQQLIFECVLAKRDKHVRIQPDRNPTGKADRQPDRALQSENAQQPDREADRGKKAQPDRHPVLSSTSTTTPCVGHSTAPDGAETARAPGEHLTAPAGAAWTAELIYSSRLTTAEKQFCSKAVSALDRSDAQELLDELAGALQTGDVRSRTAYFRAIVKRHHEGTFTPEKACTVREQRELGTARAAELAILEASTPATGKRFGRGDIKRLINERRAASEST